MALDLKPVAILAFPDGGRLIHRSHPGLMNNREYRHGYISLCCAGGLGEAICYGDDFLKVLQSPRLSGDMASLDEIGATLEEILSACNDTTAYLQGNWKSVKALAGALEKSPILFSEQIEALPVIYRLSKR